MAASNGTLVVREPGGATSLRQEAKLFARLALPSMLIQVRPHASVLPSGCC